MATSTANTAAGVAAAQLNTAAKIATLNAATITTAARKRVAVAGLELAQALYSIWPNFSAQIGSTQGSDAATLAIADSAYDASVSALLL